MTSEFKFNNTYGETRSFIVDPDKTGYLTKQGGFPANWKRRLFVLKDNNLFYFKNEQADTPLGCIPLEHCFVQDAEIADNKHPNCFLVFHPNQFRYLLSADTEHEMRAWMKVIQTAKISHLREVMEDLDFTKRQVEDEKEKAEEGKRWAELAKVNAEKELRIEREKRRQLESSLQEAQDQLNAEREKRLTLEYDYERLKARADALEAELKRGGVDTRAHTRASVSSDASPPPPPPAPHDTAPAPAPAPAASGVAASEAAASGVAASASDGEPRSVLVYYPDLSEDSIMGEVQCSADMTMEDLIRVVREELDLDGDYSYKKKNIPIRPNQMSRKALDFFRSDADVLLLTDP